MVGGATGALDVVILDEAGNGVPGAVVEVATPEVEPGARGETNAVGRFSTWISGDAVGAYDLTLRVTRRRLSAIAVKTVAAGRGR